MKRYLFPLTLFALILAICPVLEAVTITTSGGGGSSVSRPATGGGVAAPKASANGTNGPALLDLPAAEKNRLADAAELARLTGLQAKDALNKLADLEGRDVSGAEIRARLVYAQECMESMEKAGKKLEDSARLVMMTWEGRFGPEDRLAAMEEFLGAMPALAWRGVSPQGIVNQELGRISSGMKQAFSDAMGKLQAGGRAISNFASKVGGAIKSGVGKVTGAVGYVHHRIGNVVGQKNWATIMAGTKFTATIVGVGVGLVVAAPATTAGALGAVAIYTVGNIGAAVSFANDMATINGRSGPSGLDQGLTRINQGTAVIGIVTSGSGPEVLVNVIGVTGNEIIGTTDIGHMTPEELAGYLEGKERENFLNNHGAKHTYREPINVIDGNDGGGGGGGCSDGCH
ncbi:hypothetical protein L2W58_12270 [Dethiosulfovibrio sp. F2B]|uniref:hypothetical protein n=1 Tax=Dethiosulfovibrio faecalis TaxID=2720018 RepID=UPI001F23B03E|nr:hypothetical protein [Dethiosulfovibrio faecalis]MCF4152571.1 hypothetical protein [Dethiosulfovibrio faecalis]